MKVIFLDIDGVLITGMPPFNWKTPDPECVGHLNRITDTTGAALVVSSCWRVGRNLPELRELLAGWGVTGKVIGRTAEMLELRGLEIGAWMTEYTKSRDIEQYVILDDDSDMAGLITHLIRCDFDIGLTAGLADQAIERLQNTKSAKNK